MEKHGKSPPPENAPTTANEQELPAKHVPAPEQVSRSKENLPEELTKTGDAVPSKQNQPRARSSRVLWQFVIPAITGTLTLFVITLQSVIYFNQLREMRKSNEASIKAANAAEKAATATEDSVRTAGEIAERDQRAWITIGDCVLKRSLAANEKPTVVIKITNSGRTPAVDVDITAKVIVTDQISEDELTKTSAGRAVSKPVLGPSSSATSTFAAREVIGNESEIDAITSERSSLVVSGFVTYADIFKRNHRTSFCSKITGTALESGVMSSCAIGNTLE